MTTLNRHDDAERFERNQLAQDRDTGQIHVDDLTEADARGLIADLLEDDIVVAVPTDHVLVYEPTDAVFEDVVQLAAYYRGWQAGRDDGDEA